MQKTKQIKFLSKQEDVGGNVVECVEWLEQQSIAQDTLGEFEIVFTEVLNNIIEHAYLYRENGEIQAVLCLETDTLLIECSDSGNQFPGIPQKKEMQGSEVRLEDLPEGGFGWFLIHSLTNNIAYGYHDGQNILTLKMGL